jgi:hypothetical protein
MGRSGQPATYADYVLTMNLPQPIGSERFRASLRNYRQQLLAREGIPDSLRLLIAQLFQRKAITECDISYGRKMILRLTRQTPKGHELLLDGALQQFLATFADITNQNIEVDWKPSGKSMGRDRDREERDFGQVLLVISRVVDVVFDSIVVAGALKELLDDD